MGKKIAKWVRRLKKGDQSAFLPLYEQTSPGLFRFLMWKTRGDKPLSEDILQDTYVKFLGHIDQLEAEDEVVVQSYLMRVARNCLIDRVARGAGSKATNIPLEDAYFLPQLSQGSNQETAVEIRELALAMGHLNEKDSEIIWLRDGLGLSHREVADQVGISEQASRQAYVRAKRSLVEMLQEKLMPLGDAHAF